MKKHPTFLIIIAIPFLSQTILHGQNSDKDYSDEKSELIKKISRKFTATDKKILYSIELIDRELFIPDNFSKYSYSEISIPLANGKTIPSVTELVKILNFTKTKEMEKVLIIGSNSGYTAALFSYFYDNIYLIETDKTRKETYNTIFANRYSNINIYYGSNSEYFLGQGPFDFIFIQGSVTKLDPLFFNMLKSKGEIIFPLESSGGLQQIIKYKKEYSIISIIGGDSSFFPPLF